MPLALVPTDDAGTLAVEIEALRKRFGRLTALADVHLRIPAGQITAVLGPNGAGKTTLIKSILGLVKPDAGVIRVLGEPVNGDAGYRSALGYMPQAARFPDNLTGREVIRLLAGLRGGDVAPDQTLQHAFALDHDLDKPVRTLSGGTRQKLNAVIAFLFRPALLILDEPTAGLDPVARRIFKDRLLELRGSGTSVVITSHVLSELDELVDNVAFLIDGRVRFHGSVAELARRTGEGRLERAIASLMTGESA
jgi:Cu-processing system ATP-binding protein